MDTRGLAGLIAVAVALPVGVAGPGAAAPDQTWEPGALRDQAQASWAAAARGGQDQARGPAVMGELEPASMAEEAGPGTDARTVEPDGAAAQEMWEFPVLRQGNRGDVVRVAQWLLTEHGHPTAADGAFGSRTAWSVRELQADGGLSVTGIIDVAAWERLILEARLGARGQGVRALQSLLAFHGHPLVTDGIFGRRTEAATRAFQQEHDLPSSGVASLRTWRALVGKVRV